MLYTIAAPNQGKVLKMKLRTLSMAALTACLAFTAAQSSAAASEIVFSDATTNPANLRRAVNICYDMGMGMAKTYHVRRWMDEGNTPPSRQYMMQTWAKVFGNELRPFDRSFGVKGPKSVTYRNILMGNGENFWFPTGNPAVSVACVEPQPQGGSYAVSQGLAPVASLSAQARVCDAEFSTSEVKSTVMSENGLTNLFSQHESYRLPSEPVILTSNTTVNHKGKVYSEYFMVIKTANSKLYDMLLLSGNGQAMFPESKTGNYPVVCYTLAEG
jgi:hypothetical protein